MRRPETASDLQQFICASSWMRKSIPEYTKIVSPLHHLMETCYRKVGKRTRNAVTKLSLSELWGTEQDSAFQQIKTHLAQSLKLAHPREGYRMCLFSDASETHWASVLTQVPQDQLKLEVESQDHEPLSFLSGSFTGSSANWSIVEKEAFAVVDSFCKLDYLITPFEVSLYTDHSNLIYIFDPIGRNNNIGKHVANKLMCCAIKLSSFRYVIEFLPGVRNVWADLLTCWAVKPNRKVRAATISRVMYAPISPSATSELDWPKRDDIISSQRQHQQHAPKFVQCDDGILQTPEGMVWIPRQDRLLILRILIAAQFGIGGHRSYTTTLASVQKQFSWSSLKEDCKAFCDSCLHCLMSASGHKVPRPLGHALHASKPNHILQFDYCYIGLSSTGMKYVLILKDEFSSFVWLFPFALADAESTVDALLEWFTSFGPILQWVSDQGTHFKNDVISKLCDSIRSSHHFTLAYCPWTNGTVEIVCHELVKALRSLSSEFQLPFKLWHSLLPIVQYALSTSTLARLSNLAPLTAFTSLPIQNPLSTIKTSTNDVVDIVTLDQAHSRPAIHVVSVQYALEHMHRDINETVSKARERRGQSHNNRTHIRKCNFDVGDFVLRGTRSSRIGLKMKLRWTGRLGATQVQSDFLFEVEYLRSFEKSIVHGTRLKFFRNQDFEITEECLQHLAFQQGEYCIVDQFLDVRLENGVPQLLVKWKGFDDEEPQWESVEAMRADIPALVED